MLLLNASTHRELVACLLPGKQGNISLPADSQWGCKGIDTTRTALILTQRYGTTAVADLVIWLPSDVARPQIAPPALL